MFSSSVQSVVFRYGGVCLCRFHCPADHERWQRENQIVDGHNLAFAEVPVEIRHADHSGILVDPTLAVFYNLGDPFRRTLAHPAGDLGNIFIFETRHLLEAVATYESELHPDRPFQPRFARVDAHTYLRQRRLLASISGQPAGPSRIEPMWVVEEALEILDNVLAAAYDQPIDSRRDWPPTKRRQHDRVEETKRYLFEHCGRALALEELARAVDTSVYHLCRVFRRHVGESIHRYLKRLRLRQGLVLLETANAPLADVALDAGFSHQSHFTEAFRREYGTTPGRVRREFARA